MLGTSVTEYGVALGISDFNGTVGGNISGTSDLAPLDEQAAMIKELFPDKKNVGLLYCSAEPNSQYQVDTVKLALEELGYTCEYYAFSDSNDLSTIATNAASASDVIYVPTDNTVASNTEIINNICQPAGVPVVAGEEGICAGCGVATLSISYYYLGTATGKMAGKDPFRRRMYLRCPSSMRLSLQRSTTKTSAMHWELPCRMIMKQSRNNRS